MSIYGKYKASLQSVMEDLAKAMESYCEEEQQNG